MTPPIGLVLLAAGASRRMGQPKGLLPYGGATLIRHAAGVALASGCAPVVVVLGFAADRLGRELDGLPVRVVANSDWDRGLGSSIRAGVGAVVADPAVGAVLVMLADQPRVDPAALAALVARHRADPGALVAADYGGSGGVPAIFPRAAFPALLGLPDDRGAQTLIRATPLPVVLVPGLDLADVDTPGDYARLVGADAAETDRA